MSSEPHRLQTSRGSRAHSCPHASQRSAIVPSPAVPTAERSSPSHFGQVGRATAATYATTRATGCGRTVQMSSRDLPVQRTTEILTALVPGGRQLIVRDSLIADECHWFNDAVEHGLL